MDLSWNCEPRFDKSARMLCDSSIHYHFYTQMHSSFLQITSSLKSREHPCHFTFVWVKTLILFKVEQRWQTSNIGRQLSTIIQIRRLKIASMPEKIMKQGPNDITADLSKPKWNKGIWLYNISSRFVVFTGTEMWRV